jgi:hypothetical protein
MSIRYGLVFTGSTLLIPISHSGYFFSFLSQFIPFYPVSLNTYFPFFHIAQINKLSADSVIDAVLGGETAGDGDEGKKKGKGVPGCAYETDASKWTAKMKEQRSTSERLVCWWRMKVRNKKIKK